MIGHVQTMLMLHQALCALDHAEEMVALGRALNPNNQRMQLAMDRQQTDIDIKRARIEITMLGIATLN
jgi:hypothetical protein